jgi:hypothetical protein
MWSSELPFENKKGSKYELNNESRMSVSVVAMKILCNVYLSFLAGYGHTLKGS